MTPMDPERWERAYQLFASAIELEPERRAAFLEKACPDDSDVRREVLSLLQQLDDSGDPVRSAVAEAALGALQTEVATLAAGCRLGRYTLVELLAAGGMGMVYVAEDPDLGRQVALKVLPSSVLRNSEHLQRFRRVGWS